MQKRENWPERMNDYFRSIIQAQFVWGKTDCCLMAADCVAAMTGEDFAADFRGKYSDPVTAYLALQKFANGGILATMAVLAQRHGWTDVEPLRAQRGDIVMLPMEVCEGDPRFDGALGICIGTLSLYMQQDIGLRGISTIPAKGQPGITHAWRIAHGRD